jgi:hypothetical protein
VIQQSIDIGDKPSAVFGACGDAQYRYVLQWPTGLGNRRVMLFIGANPSKAGQVIDGKVRSDPTVSRMRNMARELGFGWLWVVNCRAYVATDPKDVPPDPEAIGPANMQWVASCVSDADLVICAWGHLAGKELPAKILRIIHESSKVPYALALAKDGTPRHPRGVPCSTNLLEIEP